MNLKTICVGTMLSFSFLNNNATTLNFSMKLYNRDMSADNTPHLSEVLQ
jgi:hypothetical protein